MQNGFADRIDTTQVLDLELSQVVCDEIGGQDGHCYYNAWRGQVSIPLCEFSNYSTNEIEATYVAFAREVWGRIMEGEFTKKGEPS